MFAAARNGSGSNVCGRRFSELKPGDVHTLLPGEWLNTLVWKWRFALRTVSVLCFSYWWWLPLYCTILTKHLCALFCRWLIFSWRWHKRKWTAWLVCGELYHFWVQVYFNNKCTHTHTHTHTHTSWSVSYCMLVFHDGGGWVSEVLVSTATRRACSRGVIRSTMGAYPRGTGSDPRRGEGHFFPSYRQLYLSSFSDTHTHTHTCMHACMHTYTHVRACTHIHVHMTHTHMQTNKQTNTPQSLPVICTVYAYTTHKGSLISFGASRPTGCTAKL